MHVFFFTYVDVGGNNENGEENSVLYPFVNKHRLHSSDAVIVDKKKCIVLLLSLFAS